MPKYEYLCSCGHTTSRESSMYNMKRKVKCSVCGKMAKKTFSKVNALVRHRLGDPRIGRGKGV